MGVGMSQRIIKNQKYFLLFILGLFSIQCARSPIKNPTQALRISQKEVVLKDDLGKASFIDHLQVHIKSMGKLPAEKKMSFGPHFILVKDYRHQLKRLLRDLKKTKDSHWEKLVHQRFVPMEIYGDEQWGQAFITGYYNPVVEGSLWKTKKFTQPLYATPKDLVYVDLKSFKDEFPKYQKILEDQKKQSIPLLFRGRLSEKDHLGRRKVQPYYSREEIDSGQSLRGRQLELIWLDPIDAFFLEIQGSGVVSVRRKSGKKRYFTFGYAEQNGHPYVPIGRFLLDQIPLKKMSMQSIREYLQTLSREQAQKFMNKNPSYVFFERIEGLPRTYMGNPVIPGRTIATDTKYFPKGAFGFMSFKKPTWQEGQLLKSEQWKETSRFIFDHDTGGAIRGPHRVDLYWGFGKEAGDLAGVMRHSGKLIYFFPRSALSQ